MIYKFFLLAVLIRLLLATDKPFLCSGLYAGVALIFGLAFDGQVFPALVTFGIQFALASLYFWWLNRLDTGSIMWWVVAVLGIPIGFI